MSKFHLIYLMPSVLTEQRWRHLGIFLHPGLRDHDAQALILGKDLDISYHPYLSIQAKNWEGVGSRKLLLRHELVASMIEVSSQTTQFGFVDPSVFRDEQWVQS